MAHIHRIQENMELISKEEKIPQCYSEAQTEQKALHFFIYQ